MGTVTGTTARLVLRLPADLHARLRALADRHDRSLNGEIVAALRHYAEGVTEVRYVWDEPQADTEHAWAAVAGSTLRDDAEEGWEYTPEEEAQVRRMESRRAPR